MRETVEQERQSSERDRELVRQRNERHRGARETEEQKRERRDRSGVYTMPFSLKNGIVSYRIGCLFTRIQ